MVDACVADVADVAYIAHTRLQSQFDASKRIRSAANWKGIQAGTRGRFRHLRTPHELEVILLSLVSPVGDKQRSVILWRSIQRVQLLKCSKGYTRILRPKGRDGAFADLQ